MTQIVESVKDHPLPFIVNESLKLLQFFLISASVIIILIVICNDNSQIFSYCDGYS